MDSDLHRRVKGGVKVKHRDPTPEEIAEMGAIIRAEKREAARAAAERQKTDGPQGVPIYYKPHKLRLDDGRAGEGAE